MTAGWLLITDVAQNQGEAVQTSTGTVDDVIAEIDFVSNATIDSLTVLPGGEGQVPTAGTGTGTDASYTGPVAYIYSYNAFPLTAAEPTNLTGLPGATNIATIAVTAQPYDPCSTCSLSVTNGNPGSADYPGGNPNADLKSLAYDLDISVPEPNATVLTVTMLGTLWLGMVALRLRRRSSGQTE
jgi:hypothetical protein